AWVWSSIMCCAKPRMFASVLFSRATLLASTSVMPATAAFCTKDTSSAGAFWASASVATVAIAATPINANPGYIREFMEPPESARSASGDARSNPRATRSIRSAADSSKHAVRGAAPARDRGGNRAAVALADRLAREEEGVLDRPHELAPCVRAADERVAVRAA